MTGSVMTSSVMGHRKSSGHASILGGRIRGSGAFTRRGASGMGSVWDSGLEEDEAVEEVEGLGGGASGESPALPVDGNGLPWDEWGHRPVGVSVLSQSRIMQGFQRFLCAWLVFHNYSRYMDLFF